MPYYVKTREGRIYETETLATWSDCERLSAKEGRAALIEQTKTELRGIFAGAEWPTVYCVLRDVSRSGMSRRISFFVIRDNRPRCIDYLISVLGCGGARQGAKEGLTVVGCGMDMGFHVVSSLSRALYNDAARPDYVIAHEWL